MNICTYCQREFSNSGGLGSHQPYCKSNPSRTQRVNSPNAHARKGITNWAKGLTKETDPRIRSKPELVGKRFGSSLNGHTTDTKEKLSAIAKDRGLGGYIPGSGRGKKGWYQGFFCDSSWELAYVVYCLDHGISIHRNTEKRSYVWNGETRTYIPDFIVDGVLTEIKGYRTPQWMAKLESNPDIVVMYEKDLQSVFDYVKTKYGDNFVDLYE